MQLTIPDAGAQDVSMWCSVLSRDEVVPVQTISSEMSPSGTLRLNGCAAPSKEPDRSRSLGFDAPGIESTVM